MELVSVADKRAEGAQGYLPLLGLIDSEVWAFGRLNSLLLSNGGTVREACLDKDFPSEDQIGRAVEAVHSKHPQLLKYWDTWRLWQGTKSLALGAL